METQQLIILVLMVILAVIGLIKKLFKLVIIALVILAGYFIYSILTDTTLTYPFSIFTTNFI